MKVAIVVKVTTDGGFLYTWATDNYENAVKFVDKNWPEIREEHNWEEDASEYLVGNPDAFDYLRTSIFEGNGFSALVQELEIEKKTGKKNNVLQ